MVKIKANKNVLRRAKRIAEKSIIVEVRGDQPLPVAALWYPTHGTGRPKERFVRIMSMDTERIKGFEIEGEFDENPGKPRTYLVRKLESPVSLLHLSPVGE